MNRITRHTAVALLALAVLVPATAPAATRKVALRTAQAKVVKKLAAAYDEGTYEATCKRAKKGGAACTIVRTAGTGPACGQGTVKVGRRGRVVVSAWPMIDCTGVPGAPPDDGSAPAAPAPAPAPAAPAPPAPAGAPAPPATAPPAPPATLPNPNGYAKGQMCQTDSEADYRAAGFTCQASGAESCIYTDFGTTCLPIHVLFPLNADGTVGSRR